MSLRPLLLALLVLIGLIARGRAEESVTRGEVAFAPTEREPQVPRQFRLEPHKFAYEQRPLKRVSPKFTMSRLTFPSAVKTEHPANNTVHCEYFRPKREGKVPGVVVLHILGGDFRLARVCCSWLAERGIAACFVKMPYYGPRKVPGERHRFVTSDPRQTVAGMTQAVLDVRRAVAWLGSRDEVDARRLGIFGISLGGITASLSTSAEPRIASACLLLAGGDLAKIGWDSPHLGKVRRKWLEGGGTKESFAKLMASIDPAQHAHLAKDRRILMLNARRDEVIPRACTEALWKNLGRPPIHWYPTGHYSAALYLFDALAKATAFFAEQ